jgi:hypothetical protein
MFLRETCSILHKLAHKEGCTQIEPYWIELYIMQVEGKKRTQLCRCLRFAYKFTYENPKAAITLEHKKITKCSFNNRNARAHTMANARAHTIAMQE